VEQGLVVLLATGAAQILTEQQVLQILVVVAVVVDLEL
jgi:hypothetical protein